MNTSLNMRIWMCALIPLIVLDGMLVLPSDSAAQEPAGLYRISQRAAVSQTLGDAVISLDYSRPLVRGRTDLFGGVVHWGELWTPGANEATVLEVSDTVTLNGHAVPAGRWSMWIIPSQVGPWELVLDSQDSLFHTERPEFTDEQIRFVVEPREGGTSAEALTWSFPRIAQDGATMQMHWATTLIVIEVEVESTEPVLTIAAGDAAMYTGEWQMTFTPDSESGQSQPPAVLTISHSDDDSLQGRFPPGMFAPPTPQTAADAAMADMTPQERERAEARRLLAQAPSDFSFTLVPRARGVFLFGWVDDGVLLDVEEIYHEFEFEGDRAVGVTIRDANDTVFASGRRRSP